MVCRECHRPIRPSGAGYVHVNPPIGTDNHKAVPDIDRSMEADLTQAKQYYMRGRGGRAHGHEGERRNPEMLDRRQAGYGVPRFLNRRRGRGRRGSDLVS